MFDRALQSPEGLLFLPLLLGYGCVAILVMLSALLAWLEREPPRLPRAVVVMVVALMVACGPLR